MTDAKFAILSFRETAESASRKKNKGKVIKCSPGIQPICISFSIQLFKGFFVFT